MSDLPKVAETEELLKETSGSPPTRKTLIEKLDKKQRRTKAPRRSPVKKLLLGQPMEKVVNRDAMANPGSMDWFADFAARQDVVAVVAGLRRQIERDGKPGLTLRQIRAVELVGFSRRRMPGVCPENPGAVGGVLKRRHDSVYAALRSGAPLGLSRNRRWVRA